MGEKIVAGGIAIVFSIAVMWNSDVEAAINKNEPEHAVVEYCSAASIQGSKQAKTRAEALAKELKNSMTATPDMRLLSEIINILSLIELQNLVVQCAIWQQSRIGI